MARLWDIVNEISLCHTSIVDAEDFEKEYQPYLVNRAFSYHEDAIGAVFKMNQAAHLDKKLQALFYINTLRPRKRFAKWVKAEAEQDARVVAEYYGCSLRHARELVSLHSEMQLNSVRTRTDKGGTTKGSQHDSSKESSPARTRSTDESD